MDILICDKGLPSTFKHHQSLDHLLYEMSDDRWVGFELDKNDPMDLEFTKSMIFNDKIILGLVNNVVVTFCQVYTVLAGNVCNIYTALNYRGNGYSVQLLEHAVQNNYIDTVIVEKVNESSNHMVQKTSLRLDTESPTTKYNIYRAKYETPKTP